MNKLIKTGIIGSIITLLCCFTPILVWILSAIGLVSLVVYLDMVLFPLLGIFLILIIIGFIKNKTKS
jgi:mercuric ion transport protein